MSGHDTTAVYTCTNRQGRPSPRARDRQTISTVLERTEAFPSNFRGEVRGTLTLNNPRGQVSLACPSSHPTVSLAQVTYFGIEVISALGPTVPHGDLTRTFIALP